MNVDNLAYLYIREVKHCKSQEERVSSVNEIRNTKAIDRFYY